MMTVYGMIVRFWKWGVKKFLPYGIPGFIILALAKAGALLQNSLFIYAMVVGICVIIGLVAFNKLREKYYPHMIGAIGFALLLQITLISPSLIGSDIHTEYYFYYKALNGWDYTIPHPYNSAIGATVIAPFLTNVFHIPGIWIFKVVFPLLFAFVPFILYFVFKKEFTSKTAFFASIFFVIVPTWSMELTGVPRQMLGEIMFALCLFLIIVSRWSLKVRVPLLVIISILGAMFHYVIGPILVLFLGLGGFFLVFFKRRVFPVKLLGLVVGILLLCSTAFYGLVCQGLPLTCLTTGTKIIQSLVIDILPSSYDRFKPEIVVPTYPYTYVEPDTDIVIVKTEETEKSTEVIAPEEVVDKPNALLEYITEFSPLVRTAWGVDFMSVDIWGKIFRIFQYLTQLAIIIGCILLIKRRKRYSAEYLSFCGASICLLGACVFIPHFAALINATRFYHITLFLLAPVFVIGGKFIFRNYKMLAVCLIIPYFIFTSGVVFELTKQSDIGKINMPYSIILSNHRIDMVGVFTRNDIAVRDWAVANNLGDEMYVDTHTQLLLWETSHTFWRDFRVALDTGDFKSGKYIFLSERNNQDRAIIHRPRTGGSSSGRRVSYSYEEVGLDKIIEEGMILYKQGDACIVEIRE